MGFEPMWKINPLLVKSQVQSANSGHIPSLLLLMNKEKLIDLYINQNLSQRDIAKQENVSQTTVRWWLTKYGIKRNKDNISLELKGKERKCPQCKEIKQPSEFYFQSYTNSKKKGRQGSWCKICLNKSVTVRQRKYKQLAIDYKGGKCQVCSYNKYQGALEFHHLDPSEKDTEMSKFSRSPLDDLGKKELDKCVLLCSNCHREEHGRLNGSLVSD